jgi:hypothetical protein
MNVSKWVSRFAAISLLLAVVWVFQLLFVQPLIESFFTHRDSIAHSQETLARYRQLNTGRAKIDSTLKEVRTAQQNEGRLLTGGSAQLAGAKLQNRVKELVEASGASLGSMQLLPVREEEGYQRVSMAVTLKGTVASLQSILYEIENQSPYFFIEKLELRKDRGYVSDTDATDSDDLQVRIEFYGYMPRERQP